VRGGERRGGSEEVTRGEKCGKKEKRKEEWRGRKK
jgi:hypothetical protein